MKSEVRTPHEIIVETHRAVPLVELVLSFRAGSANDLASKEGSLSLAAKAMRRGTKGLTSTAIDEQIDGLGAELGAGADQTQLSIHVSVIKRNLEAVFSLMSDLVLRPDFSDEEVSRVLREMRADIIDSRNDDRTLCGRAYRRHLFAGHPFGRPANGTLATLDTIDRADAIAAWRAAMVRKNVVFGAAGDIDEKEFRTLVERYFGEMPDEAPPSMTIAEPTAVKGRRLVIVDKPDRTQSQIYIGNLGTKPKDRDHTALVVGNTIFGGTFTARLMREVRSKRGWSYGASSRLGRERVRESWSMWTFPAAKDAAECIALQLKLLEELLDKGVSDREVSFVKSYLARSAVFDVDTAGKRLGQRLEEACGDLPKDYHKRFVERVNAVTTDEVNAALRKRLSAKDLLVCITASATEQRAAIEKAVKGLRDTRVVAYDNDEFYREPVLL